MRPTHYGEVSPSHVVFVFSTHLRQAGASFDRKRRPPPLCSGRAPLGLHALLFGLGYTARTCKTSLSPASRTSSASRVATATVCPEVGAWKGKIARELATMDGEAILVGHSVGAHMLLKYLSEEEVEKPVAGLFLVAAPYAGTWGGSSRSTRWRKSSRQSFPRTCRSSSTTAATTRWRRSGTSPSTKRISRADLPRIRGPRAPVRRRSVRSRQGHPGERAMATRRQFLAGTGEAPCRFSSAYGSQGLRLGLFCATLGCSHTGR